MVLICVHSAKGFTIGKIYNNFKNSHVSADFFVGTDDNGKSIWALKEYFTPLSLHRKLKLKKLDGISESKDL